MASAAVILGLDIYLERYLRHLSGGQRQRVTMERTIVRDPPRVFLFNEPLSNLDAKLMVQMRSEIKLNHQRLKTTMVYVTLGQMEGMTMADRIVVMHSDNIEQIGAPLEPYDHPTNLFVAGFIGSPAMNIIGSPLVGNQFRFADGMGIVLGTLPAGIVNGPITLGVRPECLRLNPAGTMVEIAVIEPTGSETQVTLRVGGQNLVGVFRERVTPILAKLSELASIKVCCTCSTSNPGSALLAGVSLAQYFPLPDIEMRMLLWRTSP